MHLYRQSIILFGIVIPVAIAIGVLSIFFMIKSNMVESFDHKLKSYKTYRTAQNAGWEIEAGVNRQRKHIDRWNQQLAQETASAVNTNLREIFDHLPSKELQQTAFERPGGKGGFGSISAQNSSQIRIALRGTFRTMQRAFLELETRMPRLQLQDLKIDPSTSQSTLLNFQVTYTAWEN